MGMSIDEAIEYNKNLKMYMEISDRQDTYKFLEENHVALDIAISIMHKYQKIEEIVKNTQQLCSYGSAFIDIREVLEDGDN